MALSQVINVISTNNTKPTWSRQAILTWCNKCLNSDIQKIEDLCTGAAYCCLLDILFPDSVNLRKVKFISNQEIDYINNLIMLQQCFTKLKINKSIPIYKLVKGKFQDNYEFAIWFRLFYDANFTKMPDGYNATEKRNNQPLTKEQAQKIRRSRTATTLTPKLSVRRRSRTHEPTIEEPVLAIARGANRPHI
ncbi:microtubule-associated protein RP/EB family member 3 [Drosophila virilis]|uniref:Uncharacterized protein, isoform A n=1 Tax=Drosophila virilis TaxID=7244 RepID=B4LTB5_DROVI|nr:microtubule-associated protein RP/EB family member 3 [Drosophila virilis]XP_015028540.1 microtubule-associated protein RP/EB family member 3 [Drosophila virilis]EDW64957.1 uncharacterized protein Dvir_GJ17762, isoform A [Drosophila virilis]KRF81951.1 uncharacterized protein Dvir_GJ17762, isoform B [Drosophila virilis]